MSETHQTSSPQSQNFLVALRNRGIAINPAQVETVLAVAKDIIKNDMRGADELIVYMMETVRHDKDLKVPFKRYYWHNRKLELLEIMLKLVRAE